MLVSVIIPVYNSQDFLPVLFDGVKNQTFKDYEVIFINDSSTDNSLRLLEEYCAENSNAQVYTIENLGVSNARNFGMEKACGDYFVFWDSDDKIDYKFLEIMVENLKEQSLTICGSTFCVADKETVDVYSDNKTDTVSKNKIRQLQIKRLFNTLWNKIFNAKIIRENALKFDTELSMGEDALFVVEYLKYVKEITVVNTPLYAYYVRNTNASARYHENTFLSIKKRNLAIIEGLDKTQEDYEEDLRDIKKNFYVELVASLWHYCKFYGKDKKKIIKEILNYLKSSNNAEKTKLNLLLRIVLGLKSVWLVRIYHKIILKGK